VRNALAVVVPMIGSLGCGNQPASMRDLVPATLSSDPAETPYPPDLFARRVEGDVVLYLVIDSTGTPLRDSTRVARSSGRAGFDAAALEAAAGLHFKPATRGGVPVTAPLQMPFRFRLPDSIKNPRDHQ
jgi:TonB family protein